jgi:hypothetical protein
MDGTVATAVVVMMAVAVATAIITQICCVQSLAAAATATAADGLHLPLFLHTSFRSCSSALVGGRIAAWEDALEHLTLRHRAEPTSSPLGRIDRGKKLRAAQMAQMAQNAPSLPPQKELSGSRDCAPRCRISSQAEAPPKYDQRGLFMISCQTKRNVGRTQRTMRKRGNTVTTTRIR